MKNTCLKFLERDERLTVKQKWQERNIEIFIENQISKVNDPNFQ